jgi:Patatin-like phospholipase
VSSRPILVLLQVATIAASVVSLSGCSHITWHPVEVATRRWITDARTRGDSGAPIPPELMPDSPTVEGLSAKSDLGLCFSGGGNRAAAAALGQLRGLDETKLLSLVRYISAISGGAWTAVPFEYLPSSFDDSAFLGPYRSPETVSVSDFASKRSLMLDAISEATITRRYLRSGLTLWGHKSFAHALGEIFLDRLDLNDDNEFVTWNARSRDEAVRNNPDTLEHRSFRLVEHVGRPYLVVGGTIRSFDFINWSAYEGKRIPVEYTPLYSGVRHRFADPDDGSPIGGGYIETFAYDSKDPRPILHAGPNPLPPDDAPQPRDFCKSPAYDRKNPHALSGSGVDPRPDDVWGKNPRYCASLTSPFLLRAKSTLSLADIMASSGAAPGEADIASYLFWFPYYWHWSPASDEWGPQVARLRAHMDGGLSDNLGLLSLLARHVKNVIAFVNTEQRIDPRADRWVERYPDYVISYFDPTLIPAGGGGPFSTPGSAFSGNKVFGAERLRQLHDEITKRWENGEPLVYMDEYDVEANPLYEITPYRVKIAWVFLGPPACSNADKKPCKENAWVKRIADPDVRTRFTTRRPISSEWNLRDFPHSATFLANGHDVILLETPRAAALAHFTSWVVADEADHMRRFFGLPPKDAR